MSSTTWIVLVPGCFWIASTTQGSPSISAPPLSFCTPSRTSAMSFRRTGAPLRQVTIRLPNASASLSWPSTVTL